ncbi:hypothetical protein [Cytobacillus dafuensis]|uniref:Uncharacterized protein n=1 Tax=Cytobacillus dafuensis TaxID=1742359 RepID=A0A5B8Z5V9_CYTDA|nr:hypothetical protein [Cytobacillus dafuensis]QED46766.1 hypothetical protein FSZ17_05440 [Cytobacillus dafuensis]
MNEQVSFSLCGEFLIHGRLTGALLQNNIQQTGAIVEETNDYLLWYCGEKFNVVVVNVVICCTKRIDTSRYNSCSSILFLIPYIMCDIIIGYLVIGFFNYFLDF